MRRAVMELLDTGADDFSLQQVRALTEERMGLPNGFFDENYWLGCWSERVTEAVVSFHKLRHLWS